jgi:multiple sugar transport system ATP-binding protein
MATVAFEHVTKRFDDGTLAVDDLNLEVAEGEFLILVGPSGCGKTTALRMIAGLEEVSTGEIHIGGKNVANLPPARRDVAMVFQNYALYPHMTVYDNISFPLRQQRLGKTEIERRVADAARLLGLEELLGRKPKELSGGQRQRVAMGRAIVRKPQAFLMDERLSNLDAKLRVDMRAELLGLHQRLRVTTVYVTHDQTEAMTLGDRVVVMRHGVVQQVDAPESLYRNPANTFVAGFIGTPSMNFVSGELRDRTVFIGTTSLPVPESRVRQPAGRAGRVIVGVRPEDFTLERDPGGAPPLRCAIEIVENLGPEQLVHFRAAGVEVAEVGEAADADEPKTMLIARFDSSVSIRSGEQAEMWLRSDRIQLFDPENGASFLAS